MTNMHDQILSDGQPINKDTVVTRVFARRWLLDMFKTKKLALRAPHKWDDPFENFLMKCTATVMGEPNVPLAGVIKNFYGQCWSLSQETDATWRIYAPAKDGVRVQTTVGRLLASIYDPHDPFRHFSYYMGSVKYMEEKELKAFFEDPSNASDLILDQTGVGQSRHLFVKRMEFEHEKEVRLLYQYNKENDSNQRPEEMRYFDIDPGALFDEVLIDPRMNIHDVTLLTKELRGFGYTKPINQSPLYQLPNLNLTINSPS